MPVVRLGNGHGAILDGVLIALLCEVLRNRWFPRHVERLGAGGRDAPVVPRPPELVTVLPSLVDRAGIRRVVYPDPPLGTDELELLAHVSAAFLAPIRRDAVDQPSPFVTTTTFVGGQPGE